MRRFLLALLLCLAPSLADAATPTLDASGAFTNKVSTTTSLPVTVSTTSSGDIVVLAIWSEATGTPSATVSSVSGGGLTWSNKHNGGTAIARQATATNCSTSNTCYIDHEIWWAYASGTLTSQVITATLSKTIDDASVTAFGVNGQFSNTAPWDTNIGLPLMGATNLSGAATTIQTNGINTTEAHDFVIAGFGSAKNQGTGYHFCVGATALAGSGSYNTGGTNFSSSYVEYVGVSTTQSSAALGLNVSTDTTSVCASSGATSGAFTMLVDAITGDGAPVTAYPRLIQ